MKKSMLILISVVMIFTACDKSSTKTIDPAEEFNGVMFGMTKEEVINVIGKQPDNVSDSYGDFLTYENEVYFNITNAQIDYSFDNNGELDGIIIDFSLSESMQDEKPIDFDSIKKELLKRYPEETFTYVKDEDNSFNFVTDTRVVGLYNDDYFNKVSVSIGDAVKGREELNQSTTT